MSSRGRWLAAIRRSSSRSGSWDSFRFQVSGFRLGIGFQVEIEKKGAELSTPVKTRAEDPARLVW